jgi:hypothetical protein
MLGVALRVLSLVLAAEFFVAPLFMERPNHGESVAFTGLPPSAPRRRSSRRPGWSATHLSSSSLRCHWPG